MWGGEWGHSPGKSHSGKNPYERFKLISGNGGLHGVEGSTAEGSRLVEGY